MKIAILSTNLDLGGAAIVTRRLADALRREGHDARMIVARGADRSGRKADGAEVITVNRLRWGAAFLAERAELFARYGVKRPDLFKVSTGRFGCGLEHIPFLKEADAVIVSWSSQGFLSLEALERLVGSGRPVIYMMHDLWPATALCHMPGDCRGYLSDCYPCPYLRGGKKLISMTMERKRRIFHNPALKLVAVSRWQAEKALEGSVLRGVDIEVIPHPFPVEEYAAGEKNGPDGRRTIVMAAARLDDEIKDLPMAVEALNIFASRYPVEAAGITMEFVGELRDASILEPLKIRHNHLGILPSDKLRELMGRASVVISSSKFETMGATLMEGMAAGAVPATFGEGGQRDIVTDGRNGFIAADHTASALAEAIHRALTCGFTPGFLHNEVASRFSPAAVARRVLSLLPRN